MCAEKQEDCFRFVHANLCIWEWKNCIFVDAQHCLWCLWWKKGGSPCLYEVVNHPKELRLLCSKFRHSLFWASLPWFSRMRLAADPSVGVADVVRALQEALEEEGSRDLLRLLHHKYQFTWKSAPDAEWLGGDFCEQAVQEAVSNSCEWEWCRRGRKKGGKQPCWNYKLRRAGSTSQSSMTLIGLTK